MADESISARIRSRKSGALQDISNNNNASQTKTSGIQNGNDNRKRKLQSKEITVQINQKRSKSLGNESSFENLNTESSITIGKRLTVGTRRSSRLSTLSDVSPGISDVLISDDVVSVRCNSQSDPADCIDLVKQMYSIYYDIEEKFSPTLYMSIQKDITPKMRIILIDWIVDVHCRYKMHQCTLWLCINLIDRYLEKVSIARSRLQLIGVAALLIASKFEEIYPPEIQDFKHMTDDSYSRQDIVNMEADILRAIDYQLVVPTGFHFLTRYLENSNASETVKHLTAYYAEKSLHDYEMLNFKPHEFIAACLYAALRQQGSAIDAETSSNNVWSPALMQETRLNEAEVLPIARKVMQCCGEEHRTSKRILQSARRKYGHSAYLCVSDLVLPVL